MSRSREEEYVRRMRERGYEPSLAGMDDEDIEWELAKMDRGPERQPKPVLYRTYRPPDRDFAERMFKMFSRPFDPNWEMPNLDGPEFRQRPQGVARAPGYESTFGVQPMSGGGGQGKWRDTNMVIDPFGQNPLYFGEGQNAAAGQQTAAAPPPPRRPSACGTSMSGSRRT